MFKVPPFKDHLKLHDNGQKAGERQSIFFNRIAAKKTCTGDGEIQYMNHGIRNIIFLEKTH